MRRTSSAVLVLFAAMTFVACGGSDDSATVATSTETTTTVDETTTTEATALPCAKPPRIAISNISLGLTQGGTLMAAKYVVVPSDLQTQDWPEWLIAARVKGAVGIWATDGGADGTIMAIDEVSRTYTDWGAAAAPDSHAREIADTLAASDAARDVVACVGG